MSVSGAPLVKGWCPGALRPMLSGDGLVIRIRPPGGRLSSAQAQGIAALASRHGSGVIDISNRANMQLRGVREENHEALIAGLSDLDLIDADSETEARRNIIITPFWEHPDPTQRFADDLARALAQTDAPRLPGKFGFAVDTGQEPVLRTAPADIRFERSDDGSLICAADGAETGAAITPDTAIDIALSLSRWFLETGGAKNGRGRMAAHIALGTPLPTTFTAVKRAEHIEQSPAAGPVAQGYLLGLAFGQMQAETFAELANLGNLRLTPWRMILIEGLREPPELDHLITRAEDPLNRVVACPGAPFCPQAHQPTRTLARALAPHVPAGSLLHVSGCAKGCAHPGAAPRTLIGGPKGFSLILEGGASDAPSSGPVSAEALTEYSSFLKETV